MTKMITAKTAVEFFAGIGLMRAGLEDAGWSIEMANDIDPIKQRFYQNNFIGSKSHFVLEDIHQLLVSKVPETVLATASFPCTDLSLAGKRAGLKGKQSSAFWGFIDILKAMDNRKPPLVLLENVTGFLTSHNGKDFKEALLDLNELGYRIDAFIIDASNFVPQSRVRLFIIGKQAEVIDNSNVLKMPIKLYLPETTIRPAKLRDFIYRNPEIDWDIKHDLPELPARNNNLADIVEQIPKSSNQWFIRERVDYLLNQIFDRHLTKINEQKKKNYYEYFTAFRRMRNKKSMAEIRFDGVAGCLRTPKGGSARQILLEVGKGEVNVRLLNPRECARLMGADNYKIQGSANEALFGFGDAVCVPVVSWIAENYLNEEFSRIVKAKELRKEEYAATA